MLEKIRNLFPSFFAPSEDLSETQVLVAVAVRSRERRANLPFELPLLAVLVGFAWVLVQNPPMF